MTMVIQIPAEHVGIHIDPCGFRTDPGLPVDIVHDILPRWHLWEILRVPLRLRSRESHFSVPNETTMESKRSSICRVDVVISITWIVPWIDRWHHHWSLWKLLLLLGMTMTMLLDSSSCFLLVVHDRWFERHHFLQIPTPE